MIVSVEVAVPISFLNYLSHVNAVMVNIINQSAFMEGLAKILVMVRSAIFN